MPFTLLQWELVTTSDMSLSSNDISPSGWRCASAPAFFSARIAPEDCGVSRRHGHHGEWCAGGVHTHRSACLFFMMYPIMVKIDFHEVVKAGKRLEDRWG